MSGSEERQAIMAIAREASLGDDYAILCGALDRFEARIASGNDDPKRCRETIKRIVGAIRSHGKLPRSSKKAPRGLGYNKDDAQIVASLPDFDGNMAAAIRAHFPEADDEKVKVHAARIREHHDALKAVGEG